MSPVFFASSNPHKFSEVRQILELSGIAVEFARLDLTEIQADQLEPIARGKAREASRRLGAAAFVEDAGLFIDSLGGFPGPYSAYVFRTVGIGGLLRVLRGEEERRAEFRSVIACCEPGAEAECFSAIVRGVIAATPRGQGWGYDPIFIPDGMDGRTYGELGAEKNACSHRRNALELFAGYLSDRA